jgi:hypothetical protein
MTLERETPIDETTVDIDEAIHSAENPEQPPAMPPESEEDFEKAVQGNMTPDAIHIPANNAD